jgi:hypothetical protein
MAITVDTLLTDGDELRDSLSDKFSMLWDNLLNNDNGIGEDAYNSLVDLGNIIDPYFVKSVSRYVDATDGRFYLKENV